MDYYSITYSDCRLTNVSEASGFNIWSKNLICTWSTGRASVPKSQVADNGTASWKRAQKGMLHGLRKANRELKKNDQGPRVIVGPSGSLGTLDSEIKSGGSDVSRCENGITRRGASAQVRSSRTKFTPQTNANQCWDWEQNKLYW